MAEIDAVLKGKVHYYGREHYYQAMQDACVEASKKFGKDPVYGFYSAVAHLLQGHTQEAIRALQPLQNDRDVMLGTILALIYGHRHCQVVDKEAVAQLDARLKEERKKASQSTLYYAGVFLFLSSRYDKAREYVDRMLKMNPESLDGRALKGWIELQAGRDSKNKNTLQFFDAVLEESPKHMDSLFGKAKHYESQGKYSESMDTLNLLVVSLPGFTPPLVEKIKVHLAEQDWDQCLDAANRVLTIERHNIEAQKYRTLYVLCRQGNYEEAAQGLRNLYSEMDRSEPNNAALFIHMAQLFSRLETNNVFFTNNVMRARRASTYSAYGHPGGPQRLNESWYGLSRTRSADREKLYDTPVKVKKTTKARVIVLVRCSAAGLKFKPFIHRLLPS
ncbi:unnamed protein product, partial [Meganyctiphanes norvegica]